MRNFKERQRTVKNLDESVKKKKHHEITRTQWKQKVKEKKKKKT